MLNRTLALLADLRDIRSVSRDLIEQDGGLTLPVSDEMADLGDAAAFVLDELTEGAEARWCGRTRRTVAHAIVDYGLGYRLRVMRPSVAIPFERVRHRAVLEGGSSTWNWPARLVDYSDKMPAWTRPGVRGVRHYTSMADVESDFGAADIAQGNIRANHVAVSDRGISVGYAVQAMPSRVHADDATEYLLGGGPDGPEADAYWARVAERQRRATNVIRADARGDLIAVPHTEAQADIARQITEYMAASNPATATDADLDAWAALAMPATGNLAGVRARVSDVPNVVSCEAVEAPEWTIDVTATVRAGTAGAALRERIADAAHDALPAGWLVRVTMHEGTVDDPIVLPARGSARVIADRDAFRERVAPWFHGEEYAHRTVEDAAQFPHGYDIAPPAAAGIELAGLLGPGPGGWFLDPDAGVPWIEAAGHRLGDVVRLDATGDLPGGLERGVDYRVTAVDGNRIQLGAVPAPQVDRAAAIADRNRRGTGKSGRRRGENRPLPPGNKRKPQGPPPQNRPAPRRFQRR